MRIIANFGYNRFYKLDERLRHVRTNTLIRCLLSGSKEHEFKIVLEKLYPDLTFEESYEWLIGCGLPIVKREEVYTLDTLHTSFKDQTYCIVDIETNGSKPQNSQIIEIGAVKLKNGEIIDEFSSLVKTEFIPQYIRQVTGITPPMLVDAPSQKEVLRRFRLFIEDSVFVAHDANFDFYYIDAQLKKEKLGSLYNRFVCSLNLAKKTIKAERYGLKYLTESLELPEETLHRALGDALTTTRVFLECIKYLPKEIESAEDIVSFSFVKKNKKKRKKPS